MTNDRELKEAHSVSNRDIESSRQSIAGDQEIVKALKDEFDQLFEIPIPICYIDKNFNIILLNEAFASFFRSTKDELINKKCYELRKGPFCHTRLCTLQKILDGMPSIQYEGDYYFSETEKKTFIITARPFRSSTGEILGVIESFIDISDLEHVEEILREKESHLTAIFEQSPIAIEIYNVKGELINVNPRCLELFGVSNIQEVRGFKLFEDPNLSEQTKMRLSEGIPVYFESEFDFDLVRKLNLYKTKRAGKYYIRVFITPLKTKEGKVYGYLVQVEEITTQKHMEQALQASEYALRERVKDLTCLYNISQLLENKKISIPSLLKRILFLIPPAFQFPEIIRARIKFEDYDFRTKGFQITDWKIIKVLKINTKTLEITATYIEDKPFLKEEIDLVSDIGKRLQSFLLQREIETEIVEMRKNFISTFSHQLRTPLSVIQQSCNNLQTYKEKLDEEQKVNLIDTIMRNALTLSELSEELIVLGKLDDPESLLEWGIYHPRNIILQILKTFRNRIEASDLQVNLELVDLELYGDSSNITEVFRLIIDNAIKYSQRGSKINIRATDSYLGAYNPTSADGILFEVEDSGRGIPESDLPFIFQRYFRSDDVSDTPGTGLGLHVAQDLVVLHGGTIQVQSEYGVGTTIFLFLPRLEKNPNP